MLNTRQIIYKLNPLFIHAINVAVSQLSLFWLKQLKVSIGCPTHLVTQGSNLLG